MRVNDKVILRHDIKESLAGSVIPEGTSGRVTYKMGGMGRNMYEVDFGQYGVAICDKDDIELAPKDSPGQ